MSKTFNLEAEAEKISWTVDGYNHTKVITENDAIDLARRYAEAQQTDKTLLEALDSSNQTTAVLVKRLASTMKELVKLRARCDAMHEAIEVYALPLIWALKCDGKLADGTTAEKVLRAVATPPYVILTQPARTERAEQ